MPGSPTCGKTTRGWSSDSCRIIPTEILLNSVVLAELFYGAHHDAVSKRAANLALISRLQQRCTSDPRGDTHKQPWQLQSNSYVSAQSWRPSSGG